jgi:hypothetical protein
MAEPDGIQREPSASPPKPLDIQASPEPPDVALKVHKCPHCDHSLTTKDVALNRCWYCNKRLTDPIEPKQPGTPFLAKFGFGFVGAILGMALGLFFLGNVAERGSWTISLCAGVGYATGTAIAMALFGGKKKEPPKV